MKATSPETLANKEEHELLLSLQPGIGFHKVLSSRFTLDQTTCTVGNCPDYIFKQFIAKCVQAPCKSRRWNHLQQEKLLRMLEQDCSDVARWYAIDTLLEHKVIVPLEMAKPLLAGRTP